MNLMSVLGLHPSTRLWSARVRIAALLVCFVLCSVPGVQGQSAAPRTVVATRIFTASDGVQDGGPLPVSQRVSLVLTLAPAAGRDADLGQFLSALTTVGSPSYHQWLTPATFRTQFGVSADQLATVSSWAQAQGLSVDAIAPSGVRLTVSGSASQVEIAFATTLHLVTVAGKRYHANQGVASLPVESAAMFTAIEGLNDVPSTSSEAASFAGLATQIDENATAAIALSSATCLDSLTAGEVAEYMELFNQAAAQGISVVDASTCAAGAFPAALSQVTAVALAGSTVADTGAALEARPAWQVAPGLPADAVRHTPDLTVPSLSALMQAILQLAGGGRLGNLNPALYLLATEPGLYTQPDGAPAGTWEQGSGLGLIDLHELVKVFPRGAGSSSASFQATNYSPSHGQATSFTSAVASGTGGAIPTGTVAFVTSSGTTLGTAALVNGTASFTTGTLDGGTYILAAVYSGDATYASSKSPNSQIYVGPEASQLSVAIGGSPVIGGTYTVTVTDTAPSGVGNPSGAAVVTLSATNANYTATLAPTIAGSSAATVSIPANPAGTLTLSVNCTPSANYSCSNPYTTTVTVAKATPTLSIAYQPNPPVSGATITLNAAVSPVGTAPVPTGAVTFFDNGVTLNAANLDNGSTATTGIVPTSSTHSITAAYAGDSNYLSVSTTATSTSSGTITTATSLQASPTTVSAGQTVTLTAVIAPASTGPATPAGSVQFFDGGTLIGTANVTGYRAVFAISTLSASVTHTILAVYSGDGYYSVSTSAPVVLGRSNAGIVTVTTLSASANSVTLGQSLTFTATIAPASAGGANATGSVTFFDGPVMVGSASVAGNVGSFATASLAAGVNHSITAVYSGDGTYAGSTSQAVLVNKAASTIATTTVLTASTAVAAAGQNIAFLATVTPAVMSPVGGGTGNVFFYDGTMLLGSAMLSKMTASFATTTLSATVSHAITAVYVGDANYTGSTSDPVILNRGTGATPTMTMLAVSNATSTLGAPLTFSASVTPAAASGTVQFVSGGSILCSALMTVGTASCPATTLPLGTNSVTANYLGDSVYTASVSAPTQVTVAAAAGMTSATLTVLLSPATAQPGATVNVMVTVAATGGILLSGNVVATVNGNVSTSTLSGTASSYTVALPLVTPAIPGMYSVVVACSGGNVTCIPVTATLTSSTAAAALIATTTVLTATPTAMPTSASAYLLKASITPAATGAATPTGTVIFYDGLLPIATATVSAGAAVVTNTLGGGATHGLTASYSGDAVYASSVSTVVKLAPGNTAAVLPVVTLGVTYPSVPGGGNILLMAMVTGSTATGLIPTGSVSFYAVGAASAGGKTPTLLGAATLGTGTGGASTAVFSTSAIPTGTQAIYAVYAGDGSFTAATSSSIAFGVSSFSLIFTPATLTLTAGASGQATGLYAMSNNLVGTLTLGCEPPPGLLMTCSFTPSTLTASGSTMLTVTTSAPHSQSTQNSQHAGLRTSHTLPAVGGLSLAALFCWLLPGRRRRLPSLVVALLVLALTANLGCSNGSFLATGTLVGGTPLGTTLLTITSTVTDGVNTVRRTDTYPVTVQ